MIKNFPLSDIHQYFDSLTIDQAQKLRQNGAINKMQQPINKLWAAGIDDGTIYDVEVQLFGLKVKAYTCTCIGFSQKFYCRHTVALMLQIKSFLIDTKKENKGLVKKTVEREDISLYKLLSNVTKEDLIDFIVDSSKTDKKVGFAAKARFLSENEDLFDLKLYTNLLADTVKSFKSPNGQITVKGWSQIDKIFQDLLYKSRTKILEKEYIAAVEILKPIYLITMQLSRTNNAQLSELKPFFNRTLEYLHLLSTQALTPKIKSQIVEFICEDYKLFPYQPFAFDLLMNFTKQLENIGALPTFNTINTELLKLKPKDPIIVIRQIHILKYLDKMDRALEITEKNFDTEPKLFQFADLALGDNLLEIAYVASTLGYEKYNKAQQFGDLLLKIATLRDDKENQLRYGKELFTMYPNIKYYQVMQIIGFDKKELSKLVKETKMDKKTANVLAIEIELLNKDYVKVLEKIDTLESIEHFTPILAENAPKEYLERLNQLTGEYLYEHLGKTPAITIRNMIKKLHKIKKHDLATKYTDWVRSNYADRFALLEEIRVFR
jgi:SWIM zinc finger